SLLWNFMGSSQPYTIFSGLLELSGAVLLIFRRTALVGALLAGAVLTNVLVLDICYDVPVKTFAAHLVAMCAFLVAPELRRLAEALLVAGGPRSRAAVAAQLAAVVLIAVPSVDGLRRHAHAAAQDEGAYRVDSFSVDG